MSQATGSTEPTTTRRTLLCCGAAVLAGGSALAVAGCGPSNSIAKGDSKSSSSGPVDLGPATAVPVGGGKVFADQRIVVTQPSAGQYKAFSARCTHAGCLVDQVKDNLIQCPCHGSRFNVADGSVADGPAPSPLPSYQVTVTGGNLSVTTA
ncbi:Rieske (2Fe-2S) protein [Kitasatospora sp. NBC_01287]|uniref:Rieske (2Fe-2S) protein n=1 Tax=Kitasatospora sp. NBC_01287 TaxID=2903573 RepID=UPI002256695F|nr:Rieske (2Fe-2S) protein [Kitasatospora sp. NBC_01287]MCX4746270.1 Rieske (2Fe-2S) protein [Kitasatospora sp. NBC_01287]